MLAQIAAVFGEHGVSIASMIQKGRGDEAELVLITHPTKERILRGHGGDQALDCCRRAHDPEGALGSNLR